MTRLARRLFIFSLLLNIGLATFAYYETSYADHLLERVGRMQ